MADTEKEDRRLTRGAKSKGRILDAGLTILHEQGYGALSISAVCKRAGVSATSLYHHFGDKSGLLSAMIDEALARNSAQYLSGITGLNTPLAQLEMFMETVRRVMQDDAQNSGAILMALSQARGANAEIAEVISAARQRIWAFIADKFAEFFVIDDGIILAHIFSAFSSYIPQVRQGPDSEADVEALIETLRMVLLMVGAIIQPAMLNDPEFKKAVEEARLSLVENSENN